MRKFLEIAILEGRALLRSKTLAMLTGASVLWMLAFPRIVTGDGTSEGLRELTVRYSLGGVLLLLVVALVSSATGSLARERTEKRLQLTLVRPVRYVTVFLGKAAAHVAAGAVVLAISCLIVCLQVDCRRACHHVLFPELPSPREEAESMYAAYLKDPATPPSVRHARKEVVLRILENRAMDHYQTLPTNAVSEWKFPVSDLLPAKVACAVRMRFTNAFEMRQEVRGAFSIGARGAVVSNSTQAVVIVPLALATGPGPDDGTDGRTLRFRNDGAASLMLRPRRDLSLLVTADAFWRNLLRAYAEMVALLAFVVAVGLCLSAGLGRPVALFVAIVMLIVSEMSPSVVEQYPETLESGLADRIGLRIARLSASLTRPVSALSPLEALSKDECIEAPAVARLVLVDLLLAPVLLALVAAFVLPRKQDD